MEPIRLWRRNLVGGREPAWVEDEPKHPIYFTDFYAVRCADYEAMVKDAAMLDRALRDEAARADAALKQRDEAVARAERAEALMREARLICDADGAQDALDLRDRIDALLNDPTPDDRKGEDGSAIDGAWVERGEE